ncbi:MAG TPA: chemotaxis protein CheB [Bryobacteraceae bacterium]|jgi:two-component system chemotaxis response regulator CheB|nr:chemotaxis protein CheB [Bryobacteraceae bacterium]
MEYRDIVVIGASAGGIRALETLSRRLPAGLEAAIFIVMHTSPDHESSLPEILSEAGPLPAVAAHDGVAIEKGRIYVAPSDCHTFLEKGTVRVAFGPRENFFRPAIDPLFRSAASVYGRRVIGILLSGGLDDGCNGLQEIRNRHGLAVVQEPSDADVPHLPMNALRQVDVNYVLPAAQIADFLAGEVRKPLAPQKDVPMIDPAKHRRFDGITCPDCNGPIFEEKDVDKDGAEKTGGLRFACIAGHSYSPGTMRVGHARKLENALWSAIATFQEHATVLRRLAQNGTRGGENDMQDLEEEARQQEEHAAELRAFIEKWNQRGRTG